MKFTIAALVATVAAKKSDFPTGTFGHAHCKATSTVNGTCAQTFANFEDSVMNRADPSKGHYTLKEEANLDYIWGTRLGAGGKYTDDVMWEFKDVNGGCQVSGSSRSQSLSLLDYNTNYCNIYNVFRMSGMTYTSLATTSCSYNDQTACD